MDRILQIIKDLQATTKRTEKEVILKLYQSNFTFREILHFVYNPFIVTGISDKKMKKGFKTNIKSDKKLSNVFDLLEYLKQNNTGKDIDITNVVHFLNSVDKEVSNLLYKIVTKNLKLGITAKTINKIYGKDFIPEFNVMLAENYQEHKHKIKGKGFTLTEKINGKRCILKKINGKVEMYSREGYPLFGFVDVLKEAERLPDNYAYDGELRYIDITGKMNDDTIFRKTISICNSDDEVKRNICFRVFDVLPIEEFEKELKTYPYTIRMLSLKFFKNGEFIQKLPILYIGKDLIEIDRLLKASIKEGKEGLMLNINSASYEFKRTDKILKVVKPNRADVKVIDVVEGTNKNKGKLGSIVFEFIHEGKKWKSECGTGFSDEEREEYYNDRDIVIDKIVTIEYKNITKNKKGVYSIRNSSWKSIIRNDKDEISMH